MKEKCEKWWGTKHDFAEWEIVEKGEVVRQIRGIKVITGFFIQQQRKCKRCGYIQIDSQTKELE
jgi:hypothetical protein